MSTNFDLIVIGAGPGGYVAAIRAAQLGMNVACIEKEPALGGTCLRVGCIPSKALLESSELYEEAQHSLSKRGIEVGDLKLNLSKMLGQKDETVSTLTQGVAGLFKKNKITRYQGHARFNGPGKLTVTSSEEEVSLSSPQILIATGSVAATLPGVELDGDRVVTSTEALTFEKVPEHLVVIGGGAIGLEMGTVWRRLGSKVTVLEYLDRLLPAWMVNSRNWRSKFTNRRDWNFISVPKSPESRTTRKTVMSKSKERRPSAVIEFSSRLVGNRILKI